MPKAQTMPFASSRPSSLFAVAVVVVVKRQLEGHKNNKIFS